jgi:hypothetical protein
MKSLLTNLVTSIVVIKYPSDNVYTYVNTKRNLYSMYYTFKITPNVLQIVVVNDGTKPQ